MESFRFAIPTGLRLALENEAERQGISAANLTRTALQATLNVLKKAEGDPAQIAEMLSDAPIEKTRNNCEEVNV